MLIHRQCNDSFNSEDLEFANWADFRRQGKAPRGGHHEMLGTTDDLPTAEVMLNTVVENTTAPPEIVKL